MCMCVVIIVIVVWQVMAALCGTQITAKFRRTDCHGNAPPKSEQSNIRMYMFRYVCDFSNFMLHISRRSCSWCGKKMRNVLYISNVAWTERCSSGWLVKYARNLFLYMYCNYERKMRKCNLFTFTYVCMYVFINEKKQKHFIYSLSKTRKERGKFKHFKVNKYKYIYIYVHMYKCIYIYIYVWVCIA